MAENEKKNKRNALREMDLTTGNLFWKIPLFALPMAVTTILQLLYTTVDLWTVSHYGGGSNSMSAVGSNSALINLIITVFVGMSLGANVTIANAKGANDPERASRSLHTSMILAVVSGVFVGVIGFFLAPYLLELMDTPEHIISLASQYLKIYFVGLPFLMVYNYASQILRALGDSRRPLFILIISGAVNILFDPFFVIVFHLDVAGVAWATVISEAVSAILGVWVLARNKNGFIRFSFKKLKVDRQALKEIIQIGLPAGIQGLAFNIPNVLIQANLYTITQEGVSIDDIVAGAAAAAQIEGYIYALVEAFDAACVSMTGQNYGAGKKENLRKGFWYSLIWEAISCGLSAIIILLWSDPLIKVFLGNDETTNVANAVAAGRERIYIVGLTYFLDGVMAVCAGYLRGMKHSTTPAVVTLIGCTGSRILFLYTLFRLPYFHTITWLYAAFPISWILVDLAYIPITIIIEKKAFARIDARTPSPEAQIENPAK